MAEPAAVLDLDDVSLVIGGRTIVSVPRWSLAAGEHAVLVGPSGSGKTSLIHMVAGLLTATSGAITIAGQRLRDLVPVDLDLFRGRHVGIVFQNLHLVEALSVLDNLRLARFFARLEPDGVRLRTLLDGLGVGHTESRKPHQLSQGERQRVAIARALANAPRLILADEPTSALDDDNAAQVVELLFAQARAHDATLLVATHDARIAGRFGRKLALERRA